MKLITRGSYLSLTMQIDCQCRAIDRLERTQEIREKQFYEVDAKNARLSARVRAAEAKVTELTLLIGYKGFVLERTPDMPATPAIPGVLTLTKISKGN